MKLLNHTLLYLSGSLLVIITIWAGIFYVNMLDEVHDSIDDGLENYKILVIQKAHTDSTILHKNIFDESNYAIRPIPSQEAAYIKETYVDTLMYMQNEEDYEPVRLLTTAFCLEGKGCYELKIISSMVEEDDLIEDLFYALVWLYIAIIVSVILINNVILKKIWQPFYLLIDQLRNFRLRNEKVFTAPETKVTEFKDLNETILALLQNNLEAYNSQKQFIENAAHELQTPLAISINKLELMLEQPLQEDQAGTVAGVIENLERLTRLNKSLLLLTKIENKQFTEEDPVNFNELISKQKENFAELLDYKAIEPEVTSNGIFTHNFNRDLADMLATNLLKNAIIHNHKGGRIDIQITENQISFSNTGSDRSLDKDKIFGRFYKTHEQKSSTGLGLAIVKAISELFHLKVQYEFDGLHHFIIRK